MPPPKKKHKNTASEVHWLPPSPDKAATRDQSSTYLFRYESIFPDQDGGRHKQTSRPLAVPLSPEKKKPSHPSLPQQPLISQNHDAYSEVVLELPDLPEGPDRVGTDDAELPADDEGEDASEDRPRRESWFIHDRDDYISELLFTEGRGYASSQDRCAGYACPRCSDELAYRCRDCFAAGLFCQSCIVSSHQHLPFHAIEKWKNGFFRSVTLKQLGLRLQLGHVARSKCLNPIPREDFVILDSTAQHSVSLDFCGCPTAVDHARQLLRSGLYPATTSNPRTACTFNLMRHYGFLSAEGDFSTWEMYRTLTRGTDNTGTTSVPDRYSQLCEVFRQWRHLQLHKRGGSGHSLAGVKGAGPGALAILCPACPQFGINTTPKSRANEWLNTEFIGMDANFRLKRYKVSSIQRDPPLNNGCAYMVNSERYDAFLEKCKGLLPDPEPKGTTCSQFKVITDADTNTGKRIAVNGIAAVDCIRHGYKKPTSMADIIKGEKYIHMDYCFFSAIEGKPAHRIVSSYDISCQWSLFLARRRENMPQDLGALKHDLKKFVFLVPKFHLPAHVESCRLDYSFNTTFGVGRTDGEAVERNWSYFDRFAGATRQMGPGTRGDFLDSTGSDWNWRRDITLHTTFHRKISKAIMMAGKHVAAHEELTSVMQPHHLKKWTKQVEKWEKDKTAFNPYKARSDLVPSQKELRRRIQVEERNEIERGGTNLPDDGTPSRFSFVASGMDLEEQQHRLVYDLEQVNDGTPEIERTKIARRQAALAAKLKTWFEHQQVLCPTAASLRKAEDREPSPCNAPTSTLHLPSELPPTTPCNVNLLQHEWDLRVAEAYDALESVRSHLRSQAGLNYVSKRFWRGQKAATRSNQLKASVRERVKESANRYRHARASLERLVPRLNGKVLPGALRNLSDPDLRPISEGEDGQSEGNRTISWIWKVIGVSDDAQSNDELQDTLRVEWVTSRARAARWKEEIALLLEEMNRVIRFFAWKESDWQKLADELSAEPSLLIREGRRAYALQQSDLYRRLYTKCANSWRKLPTTVEKAVASGIIDQDHAETYEYSKHKGKVDSDESDDDSNDSGGDDDEDSDGW